MVGMLPLLAAPNSLAKARLASLASPYHASRKNAALAAFRAEAPHCGRQPKTPPQFLPAADDAEFGGLLDGVGGVGAGIGEADDLGFRGLRLQQEGGEILSRERMAYL